MIPHVDHFSPKDESGIRRVVEAYFQYLPDYGIELVEADAESYDIKVVHAGTAPDCNVAQCHGLYWTADYPANAWEYKANASVVKSMRSAREIIVPSEWVAEAIKRDMRRVPAVIGHGIDAERWRHDHTCGGYVLWNKNRVGDVCDPAPVGKLARRYDGLTFVTTFAPHNSPRNVREIGLRPHGEMMTWVQKAALYLATTKETFGIGILEAMAAGVPVLGFAHGGIVDIVQHGVCGYLARPGDYDDLYRGLEWCLQHRETLGRNGQELVRAFTWPEICRQVAQVYARAAAKPEPTAAIIIPSYNYAGMVGRAIKSAMGQDYGQLTDIIVVDDGSTDDGKTGRVVAELSEQDQRVKYIRQNNAGVANARNRGIRETSATYIACLDADDALEPAFISACVEALEEDDALGIAYTGLRYVKPDGATGISPWPTQFDYDKQLNRRNQIPTACVFRRDMWARLGGYKQRYAPQGAGAEDAEFWTRAGAYGWGARKVTEAGLFIYSWQSGRVSGNANYKEADWLALHPFSWDGRHPFASLAKPEKLAHPVRQYDEPGVSVIIPVGPGHWAAVIDALDSVEAQTMRKWEAIVVDDSGEGVPPDLAYAYPYVRWAATGGRKGAGFARNVGARMARGPFLLFLDADDSLYPKALEEMLRAWGRDGPAVIYTDYIGKAIIATADLRKLAPNLRKKVLSHNEQTGETIIEYSAHDYDCAKAQAQPELPKPYLWCNVTALLPKLWHDEIGGFDESLPSWEDVDYWWRMAKRGKCFLHLEAPLLFYRFYSGGRRDTGIENYRELLQQLVEKHKEVEKVGCSSCGKKRSAPPTFRSPAAPRAPQSRAGVGVVADSEFIRVQYMHGNRGDHRVIGSAQFDRRIEGLNMIGRGGWWYIDYGYHSGGEQMLVHVRDEQLNPHLFRRISVKDTVPMPEPELPPEPAVLAAEDEPVSYPGIQEPRPIASRLQAPESLRDGSAFDLQSLPGVTADIAAEMKADGIDTIDDVLGLTLEDLKGYSGIGKKRAEAILAYARKKAGA